MSFHSRAHLKALIFRFRISRVIARKQALSSPPRYALMSIIFLVFTLLLLVETSCFAAVKVSDSASELLVSASKCLRDGKLIEGFDRIIKASAVSADRSAYQEGEVRYALRKMPFEPKGHLALGLSSGSVNAESNGFGCGYLRELSFAALEIKQGIALAIGEADSNIRKLLEHEIDWKSRPRKAGGKRTNLFQEILFYRWHPSKSEQYNLAWIGANGVIDIPSANAEFNGSIQSTWLSALRDFPELTWDGDHVFSSEGDSRCVTHVDPGAIGRLRTLRDHYGTESFEKVQKEIDEYVRSRWTVKRVLDYCQPATRRALCMRTDYPQNQLISIFLLPDTPVVSYQIGLENGKPYRYIIWASLGNSVWCLEDGAPKGVPGSEDEFLLHRLSDAIFLPMKNYEIVNRKSLITVEPCHRRKANLSNECLTYGDKGKPIAYVCKLVNGDELCASLNSEVSVDSISINGKVDEDWNKAIKESDKMYSTLKKYNYLGDFVFEKSE